MKIDGVVETVCIVALLLLLVLIPLLVWNCGPPWAIDCSLPAGTGE